MFIENINSPSDLKKLTVQECEILANEIRRVLLNRVSDIGGHLGSNLGVVEATIALHYVFDAPKDKIVFDVSHQCYTHKILTGRKEAFINPEHYKSVSGYTCPKESEYDLFQIGHTATSISLASGLAKARDLIGGQENVIAFIGDGSLSGGEAFEGLDFAASELKSNFIIIVNDNNMSIAENHGGLYKNLKELRDTNGTSQKNIFTALGYAYYFCKNGNDLKSLVKTFESVKNTSTPVVVHICTTKGKGYDYAEAHQEETHWCRPFDINTGMEKNLFKGTERYDFIVRKHLLEKMKYDNKIATIIAAVPNALTLKKDIRIQAGKQLIDVAIAEEHAVAMSAGFARYGGKPIFTTLSTFFQRTYDQIFQELCINKCAATMIVIDASVYAPNDITHVGIYDIAMMSNIPNLVYLAPTNKQEYLAMLDWSIEQNNYPVAIRAPRNGVYEAQGVVDTDYSKLNKYKIERNGKKVAIIALGDFFQLGEKVVDLCEKELGYEPTLINPRYITGIDEELLNELKNAHELIVTLEDGILDGGFGEKIASFYGTCKTIGVRNYGLKKEFLDRYDVNEVLRKNRLVPELIVSDICEYFA